MELKISTCQYFLAITFLLVSCTNTHKKEITIIPLPKQIIQETGVFKFTKNTKIVITDDSQKEAVSVLTKKMIKAAGFNLEITSKKPSSNYVLLNKSSEFDSESYQLHINKNTIQIDAGDYNGFLYGIQTIIQLLPVEIESDTLVKQISWQLPGLTVKDSPRFRWRGLMLDVSRHFFNKEYVKKTIDRLAMLKMNVLHLHLVDDQGWRIEIKKYPRLTEIGAWRVDQENLHWSARRKVTADEKGTFGGYFTQEDLKEIVAHAKKRGVEVVPEIEMPAHVSSAIASYPYLSCTETPIGVPSGSVWPITDIYCAGKESTFKFLEDVLNEVMQIFPSKYIHIGGDEATKTNWKTCKHCVQRMKNEGIEDVEELQSYFIKRIEKFLNVNGKKLIGWDEILEGGLAPDATVMSWRGVKGGMEAAKQGHDVVMSPGTHCYFDHYQGPQDQEPLAIGGYTPLSKVYQFDPIVENMTEEEAAHVLGGQANLWSEYIPTTAHSEYMIFPRLAALSETLWSNKDSRDWNNFSLRIEELFKRFELLGINFSKSSYLITPKITADLEKKAVALTLQNEYTDADIRFALNNKTLNQDSKQFTEPIVLNETTAVEASLFKDNIKVGMVFSDTIQFHKAVASKVTYNIPYSDKYQGVGAFNLVNTLRGSKNFRDGNWQAWLNEDMDVTIDLQNIQYIKQVTIGSMENQGPDIYFPTQVEVFVSQDNKDFTKVGELLRPYMASSDIELKDFKINFNEREARYIKVKATCLRRENEIRGAWLFIDEILIN